MLKASKNLKVLRIKSGFAQEKIAEKLFMDQATYSRIEQGKSYLSIEAARILEEILKEPIQDFAEPVSPYINITQNNFHNSSIYGDVNNLTSSELLQSMQSAIKQLDLLVEEMKKRTNNG